MQNVKHLPAFSLLKTCVLAFFAMTVLFSCSKEKEITHVENDEQNSLRESSSEMRNSIVAVPFETTVFVPCAKGGTGEDIALTGTTNFVYQTIWNEHGFSLVYHDNVHQVTGVGVSSGEKFVASGGTNGTVMGSFVNSQWIGTTIQQMRVVGRNSQFTVTYKYHITITSDGTVTVRSQEQTTECK